MQETRVPAVVLISYSRINLCYDTIVDHDHKEVKIEYFEGTNVALLTSDQTIPLL